MNNNDKDLGNMSYYALSETLKNLAQYTIDTNGEGLPEDVKELTRNLINDVIDNSVKHKQVMAGLLTFTVTAILNSSCKLLYDKWLNDILEVDDE